MYSKTGFAIYIYELYDSACYDPRGNYILVQILWTFFGNCAEEIDIQV